MIQKKIDFFKSAAAASLALTYDDVRLRTKYSRFTPQDIDTTSLFSKNISLKTPIASAAMDTVTTSGMAIALAKLGGIGIIHTGLTIEEQRREVRRVKLHLNGLVEKPVTVRHDQTVAGILDMCEENGFEFRTFPVVDDKNRLKGLLTQNDLDFCDDLKTKINHIMTPVSGVISAPENTTLKNAFKRMKDHKKKTLPLVDGSGAIKGMYVLSDVLRVIRGNPDSYNLDSRGRLRVGAAVPTSPKEALERISDMGAYLDVAVIDTAHGDSFFAVDTLKKIKKSFPRLDVVIGNISEPESAEILAKAGADGIKVGQGPGSICTTRPETGIGCPQVTAVYECMKAVEGYGVPICADGGITNPGDISIAIAAGAHSVMLGGMLAGTKEAPGEIITRDGKMVKLYRGMGSPGALKDSAAARKRYGVKGSGKPLAEGVEKYIPYRGSVVDVMGHYIKALKKSMSYVGAPDIKSHRQKTGFRRITNAGLQESHPHDVRHNI